MAWEGSDDGMDPSRPFMTLVYTLQSLHLESGERSELPWRFETMEEAQAKARELEGQGYHLMVRLLPQH